MKEFLKPFAEPSPNAPLYISLAGKTYPDASYRVRRPDSSVSVIEYVTGGRGYVADGQAWHVVEADTVYLLPAGPTHEYFADAEHPYTKLFLNVSGELGTRLIAAYGLQGRCFFDGTGQKELFERIMSIIRSGKPDHEMQSELQGLFVQILSRLAYASVGTSHSAEAERLKNHLDANVCRNVSARELSGVLFRSPDYCLKLFRREYGTTPHAYLIAKRMETAKALLTQTNLSVAEIADLAGYTDAQYFSNAFKKNCGCCPLTYRKQQR